MGGLNPSGSSVTNFSDAFDKEAMEKENAIKNRKKMKEKLTIIIYYLIQPIFTIHLLTKEFFDADDVDLTSDDYLSMKSET